MIPVRKRRLLYTGLFGAILSRCFAVCFGAGVSYVMAFHSEFPFWANILFGGLVLAACAIVFLGNSPAPFLDDLRMDQPEIIFGAVLRLWTKVGPASSDQPGDLSWHVELEEGRTFELNQSDYGKLAKTDRVWISYYPATQLVTGVGKVKARGHEDA
jgi:hypothetical protein